MKKAIDKIKYWKWLWLKFKYSSLFVTIVLVAIATLLFIGSCYFFQKGTTPYDVTFALFSGIIASAIVTLVIGTKQERDTKEKKAALLFDAGFCLTVFDKQCQAFYNNLPQDFSERFERLYSICNEPTECMISLYQNNAELFDLLEIRFLQKINATYRYLNRLQTCKLTDQDIAKYFPAGLSEASPGMQKCWNMIKTIQDNLYYLLIKWEMAKIIVNDD